MQEELFALSGFCCILQSFCGYTAENVDKSVDKTVDSLLFSVIVKAVSLYRRLWGEIRHPVEKSLIISS